ncbi:FK506-binding protein 5-like [Myxocyprinus asiaticus]|uniref:FK506-binding protein 5-like n=1 Tax=Myxocyprinus asiaticus TaxID=70543 RepID=UPI0022212CD6|nr:FK506-binding protein 5-like [Myxocyprinus asiaticus]XP_051538266.1 FK506-binding protein 5-like [Myxocyprinus asiaticus]XP_051538267.1 FK506-binding protein 5-like [Myxocyprinus asiaticus]XP_051538268.1 FK506-binding protein 5-like [Myxocyprinus asiaticus]
MGNSFDCCGQKSPCEHTEDETKGLLHNSESKTSTKAGTDAGTSQSSEEEERHKEETKPALEVVVTKQPNQEAQTLKAQSSYSTTISMLHTEVCHAAEVNHEVPPETIEARAEAGSSAIETTETKTEVVKEIQNITPEASEVPQDSTEAPAKAVASPLKEELDDLHESLEKVDIAAVPIDDTGVTATSPDSTVAPVEEVAVEETPVKEAPVVQVDAEKNSFEPETHVEFSAEEKMIQTEELKDTMDLKHEEAGPALNDMDISAVENSSAEPDSCILGQANELDVTEKSVTDVTTEEEPAKEATAEVEEKPLGDTCSEMSELKQENLEFSESQEHSQEVSSTLVDITNGFSSGIENGVVEDFSLLKSENEFIADVTVVEGVTQKYDTDQKLSEEPLDVEIEEKLSSKTSATSTYIDSTVKKDLPKVIDFVTDKNEKVTDQVKEATEPSQNGIDSTCESVPSSPIEKTRHTEPRSDFVAVEDTVEVKADVIALSETKSLEEVVQEGEETRPQQTEEEKEKQEEETFVAQENEGKEDTESSKTQKAEVIYSSHKVELIPMRETDVSVEEVVDDESADLYLGADEIEMGASKDKPSKPLLELTIPGLESRCSLAQAVDILAYSEQEWKGNTAKSALIRKGYSEMSSSFSALRQVRGDNYCALRATLYQVLVTSTEMPTWLQDEGFLLLPERIEAREHLIGGWVFPLECNLGSEKQDSVEKLKYYLELLKKKWQAAAAAESPEEKQSVVECVFQGGVEEYGLLEALKFLMLAKAIELHHNMVSDQEVPVFCWLLFARDTSENPQTLLTNHLSQIGFSGGVEQVEMFLLGYALQHTIQAFRLYMTDTEEFVTHYPDDHKHKWPCVCIVTEDDRHYNVPVRRTVQHQQRADIMMP